MTNNKKIQKDIFIIRLGAHRKSHIARPIKTRIKSLRETLRDT